MKVAVECGEILELVNTSGSDIASGGVLELVANHFVAMVDVANGKSGSFSAEGVFELDATSADDWAAGDTLYWDPATKKLTDVAGSLKKIGYAVNAKAALTLKAKVKLVDKV